MPNANYLELKRIVLGDEFPWYLAGPNEQSRFRYYCHAFVERPEAGQRIPRITSALFDLFHTVFMELCVLHGETPTTILRMAANNVEPVPNGPPTCEPHRDHDIPHRSMLAYLTPTDGATIVEGVRHEPKEDDILFFGGGSHFHELPTTERRVVLVATFI
jgi:hypothetical protein